MEYSSQLMSLLQMLVAFKVVKVRSSKVSHAVTLISGSGPVMPAGAIPLPITDLYLHYLEILSPDEEV